MADHARRAEKALADERRQARTVFPVGKHATPHQEILTPGFTPPARFTVELSAYLVAHAHLDGKRPSGAAGDREEIEKGFWRRERWRSGTALRAPFFRFPGLGRTQPALGYLASRNISMFFSGRRSNDFQIVQSRPGHPATSLTKLDQAGQERHPWCAISLEPRRDRLAAFLLRRLRAGGYKGRCQMKAKGAARNPAGIRCDAGEGQKVPGRCPAFARSAKRGADGFAIRIGGAVARPQLTCNERRHARAVQGIRILGAAKKDVDGRVKPGHDVDTIALAAVALPVNAVPVRRHDDARPDPEAHAGAAPRPATSSQTLGPPGNSASQPARMGPSRRNRCTCRPPSALASRSFATSRGHSPPRLEPARLSLVVSGLGSRRPPAARHISGLPAGLRDFQRFAVPRCGVLAGALTRRGLARRHRATKLRSPACAATDWRSRACNKNEFTRVCISPCRSEARTNAGAGRFVM